jgi:hypothetical protein
VDEGIQSTLERTFVACIRRKTERYQQINGSTDRGRNKAKTEVEPTCSYNERIRKQRQRKAASAIDLRSQKAAIDDESLSLYCQTLSNTFGDPSAWIENHSCKRVH